MISIDWGTGEVAAIWIKRFKRGPMDPVGEARAVAGRGLVGNANQGGKRQITLIDEARWGEVQRAVGEEVSPVARRANVMVRGIELEKSHRKLLRLGECVIRIYGETRPCERMGDLQEAMRAHWRGGAFGEIIEGGTIRVGDEAAWLEE
ncbi:MAG TPA: MOSC domain-containing protein [Thermoanaerobaculia bacterium]|nr:MOSC domain-containing protein [Thermoanaerobaculia bacterium]